MTANGTDTTNKTKLQVVITRQNKLHYGKERQGWPGPGYVVLACSGYSWPGYVTELESVTCKRCQKASKDEKVRAHIRRWQDQ